MPVTGWTGEGPDAGPALPVTQMLLARREHQAGPLETALARSRAAESREARDAYAAAHDPDEYAANLVSRGYLPGTVSQLSLKLADVTAELEEEQAKIVRGERRQEIAVREHAAGRLSAWAMQEMLGGDQGDAHRAEQLQHRAESLRTQIRQAAELMAPQRERVLDPVEAAVARAQDAHRQFVTRTREALAEAQGGTARRRERRPFASTSASRGDVTECTGPGCPVCAEGRRRDAARAGQDSTAAYAPGEAVTAGYAQRTGYAETPRCAECGYMYCKCGVAGARVPARPGTPSAVCR